MSTNTLCQIYINIYCISVIFSESIIKHFLLEIKSLFIARDYLIEIMILT